MMECDAMTGTTQTTRDAVAARRYDLIIVGGGIYGVAVALESAACGLRPVLVERDEIGMATSANSLGILHGGLRYLQALDWQRYRESNGQRSWFLQNFPEQVRPLPCLMPLYNRGLRRTWTLRAAVAFNEWMSAKRNAGVPAGCHLPSGRIIGPAETVECFPDVRREGLRGGMIWYDAVCDDMVGLTRQLAQRATEIGAVFLEHAEGRELVVRSGSVLGLIVEDTQSGAPCRLRAPLVINTAGPWCRQLATRLDRDCPDLFHPSLAFNLRIFRPELSKHALAVTPPRAGSRTYFLRPSQDGMMAGTYHVACAEGGEAMEPREKYVLDMIADLNAAVPSFHLQREDVVQVCAGLLPATRPGSAAQSARPVIIDHHARGGARGLWSVSGVKYTTARHVAHQLLMRLGLRNAEWDAETRMSPKSPAEQGTVRP